MTVVLSGGALGGQEIEWPEGQETVTVEGGRYRLVDDIAVYEGQE